VNEAGGWSSNQARNGDVTVTFFDAMVDVGFIDQDGESYFIHDWHTYFGVYEDQKRKNAEKQRNKRERDRLCHGDISVTSPQRTPTKSRVEENRKEDKTLSPPLEEVLNLSPEPPKDGKPRSEKQKANDLWISAVMDAFGLIGKKMYSRVGAVVASMREQTIGEVDPVAEVKKRARNYTSWLKDCPCTPEALAKHWAMCAEWNEKVYRKLTPEERAEARAKEIAEMEAKGIEYVP